MKLCRYKDREGAIQIGCSIVEGEWINISEAGVDSITRVLESEDPVALVRDAIDGKPHDERVSANPWLTPVEGQEIWAAGVTYLRSKTARMEESDFSASAYDLVYDAPRPELFFKCLPEKAVGPLEPVGIRRDAKWNVPEPELALVVNSRNQLRGYTIGNDMSSRDIEGENLLYLPQAKVYERSCAVGPCVVVGPAEEEVRQWAIELEIQRAGQAAFKGETSVQNIKRSFGELIDYLCRSQSFPRGAILLTGTGLVPEDDFTLQPDDRIRIRISGIGVLENTVVEV